MVEYNKIKYTELKKVVMSLNDSGVLKSSVRHVAVKGPQLYDDFISTVEGMPEEDQLRLPTDVIDFFNYAIDAEEEPEPELDFEEETPAESEEDPEPADEIAQEEPDPIGEPEEPEPEPIEDPEEELIEDPEPKEETPAESEEDPELALIEEVKPAEEPAPETSEEKPKMKRLSRTPMTAKVEEGVLTIAFNEIEKSKSFQLPDKDNLVAFKVVRKRAIDFAEDCNATKGQIAAVGKTLNMAGYYVR